MKYDFLAKHLIATMRTNHPEEQLFIQKGEFAQLRVQSRHSNHFRDNPLRTVRFSTIDERNRVHDALLAQGVKETVVWWPVRVNPDDPEWVWVPKGKTVGHTFDEELPYPEQTGTWVCIRACQTLNRAKSRLLRLVSIIKRRAKEGNESVLELLNQSETIERARKIMEQTAEASVTLNPFWFDIVGDTVILRIQTIGNITIALKW